MKNNAEIIKTIKLRKPQYSCDETPNKGLSSSTRNIRQDSRKGRSRPRRTSRIRMTDLFPAVVNKVIITNMPVAFSQFPQFDNKYLQLLHVDQERFTGKFLLP